MATNKVPGTVSEQLRKAVSDSGESLREIARQSGIDIGVISRFLRRERGINDETLSVLCKYLDLELGPIPRDEEETTNY